LVQRFAHWLSQRIQSPMRVLLIGQTRGFTQALGTVRWAVTLTPVAPLTC